ncbi:252_t:CDS:2, partial [Rhizophagus irregularis]
FVIKWFDETSYTIYAGFGIAPEFVEIFEQAEEKRMELIRSKKLGPGFNSSPMNILQNDINMNNIQSSQNINSDVQSSIAPLNSSRKRNIEELKIDTQNDRKHTKTG